MPKLRISNFLLLLCITIFFNGSGHSQTPNTAARQAVASKITEPTDSEIEAYYLGQRELRPFEGVKPRLRETLKQARIDQAKQAYIEELRRQSEVAVLLAPPKQRLVTTHFVSEAMLTHPSPWWSSLGQGTSGPTRSREI